MGDVLEDVAGVIDEFIICQPAGLFAAATCVRSW